MEPSILLLLLLLVTIPVSILVLVGPFSIFTNKDGIPRNLPVLGSFPALLLHYHHILEWAVELVNRTGLNSLVLKGPWFSNLDILLTVEPADVHYTSSTRFSNFPRGPKSKEFFDVFGDGYFNLEAAEWSPHRKVHRAFFNHKGFKQCFSEIVFNKVEIGLVSVLDRVAAHSHPSNNNNNINVIDLQDLFQRYTYDLTSKLVTGYDPNTLSLKWPEVPFSKAMNTAMQAVFMRHFFPERIWRLQGLIGFGKEAALKKAKQILNRIAQERISTKHQEFNNSLNINPRISSDNVDQPVHDILTTYLLEDEHYRSGARDEVLKGSVLSLLLAGKDTTSSAMAWFFWILSRHPSVEAKIVHELNQVFGLKQSQSEYYLLLDIDQLSKLVYLHAALCETLRLYPPVPFQTRAARQADTLPTGHRVNPNSTLVVIPLYVMARIKSVWGDDCAEFKPERWLRPEDGGIKHEPSHKFFTFNSGPRICLGRDLAFTQMKAAIAILMYNYKVEILPGQKVDPVYSVVLQMKNPLNARITKLR